MEEAQLTSMNNAHSKSSVFYFRYVRPIHQATGYVGSFVRGTRASSLCR